MTIDLSFQLGFNLTVQLNMVSLGMDNCFCDKWLTEYKNILRILDYLRNWEYVTIEESYEWRKWLEITLLIIAKLEELY